MSMSEEIEEFLNDHVYPEHHFWYRKAIEGRYAWDSGFLSPSDTGLDLAHRIWNCGWLHGPYVWVTQEGEICWCTLGGHDRNAEIFLGSDVKEVEKHNARMDYSISSLGDACMFMIEKPSSKMRLAMKKVQKESPIFGNVEPHFKSLSEWAALR